MALPLGELARERLRGRANGCCPSSGATRHLPPVGEGFRGGGKVSDIAIRRPLGESGERSEPEGVPRSAALSQKAALQLPFFVTTPPVKMEHRSVRRRSGVPKYKIIFPLNMRSNDDDRRQWRKQGGVVGAAASKTRVPPKARCGCWVPQPVSQRSAFKIVPRKKQPLHFWCGGCFAYVIGYQPFRKAGRGLPCLSHW